MPNIIRYYRKTFPVAKDILVAKITGISDEGGIYADCVEYPDLKLFILPTEIAKRVVNLHKMFSPDRLYPVLTLNVDINKKLADVSYSKINETDRANYLEKFSTFQKIYKLGLEASELYSSFFGIELDQATDFIFNRTLWNIFELFIKNEDTPKSINEFYISLLENPSRLFNTNTKQDDKVPENLSEKEVKQMDNERFDEYKEYFIQNIKKRIKITDIVLSAEISLVCLQNGAVERIKNTLKSDIDPKIQINISSPRYKIVATDSDKSSAEQLIKDTISLIQSNCEKFGVKFIKQSEICIQKNKSYTFS